MALGTTTKQMSEFWQTAVEAGGMNSADAAVITDISVIDGTKKHRFFIRKNVKYIKARIGYDTATGTMTTHATIKAFGRVLAAEASPSGAAGDWQTLPNRNGQVSVTIAAAPTSDLDDNGLSRTTVDQDNCVWHVQNCNEVVFGVEGAFNGDGDDALTILEVAVCEYGEGID